MQKQKFRFTNSLAVSARVLVAVMAGTAVVVLANSPAGHDPTAATVNSIASGKCHLTYASHSLSTSTSEPSSNMVLTLNDYTGDRLLDLTIPICLQNGGAQQATVYTKSTPSGSNYFSTSVSNGTYDFYIHVRGFLVKKVSNIAMTNGLPTSTIYASLMNGDVNNDNEINLQDYAEVANNMGLSEADTTWLRMNYDFVTPQDCDLNGDEEVNLVDYAIVSANFGAEGDNP